MKNIKHLTLIIALSLPTVMGAYTLESPSGDLKLEVNLNDEGAPVYSLNYKDQVVVNPSALGITGKEGAFEKGFKVESTSTDTVDETWHPVWGQYDTVRSNYNELALNLLSTDDQERRMTLRFRLFDDGLGFRYEFPIQKNVGYLAITDEATSFNLPGDPVLYCTPGDYNTDEYLYSITPFSQLKETMANRKVRHTESDAIAGLSVQTPLLVKTDGAKPLYINIHEANLIDYGALQLDADPATRSLSAHIIPDRHDVLAYTKFPFQTPWRTIMVSDDARDILASQLIYNLCEPSAIEDTSWIKPQKFMGVWWEMFLGNGGTWAYSDDWYAQPGRTDYSKLESNGHHPANNENVRKYIDFASEHGIPALLVEGWNEGWEDWASYRKNHQFDFTKAYPDFDVDSLQAYANSKGVRLIMHHETAANAADYERQLDRAFQFMKDHGYNSVKTGYVGSIIPRSENHYSQWMNEHVAYVAKRAAEYGIMVDSHEAVRPTGLARTYPNWVAQESARGGEFESMGGNPPEHTIILPFTRLVGGPMDYTPGLFEPHPSHVSKGGTVEGGSTLAKQLALYLTMPSPLQMACDTPENYSKYLDAFTFIEEVPVDWSDSKYLEAEPGDYITVARKGKETGEWFVGGITDENARTAIVDFSFLPAGETYIATIYEDAKDAHYINNPTAYNIRTVKVTSKTRHRQPLAPGGGFAMHLRKK